MTFQEGLRNVLRNEYFDNLSLLLHLFHGRLIGDLKYARWEQYNSSSAESEASLLIS